MKIVSIVGARPQFIKAAPVSSALQREGHDEILVHTGQHYDDEMSAVFFRELDIPEPAYNLGVGSGSHGRQTGQMLTRIEEVLLAERPDWVLVYGDTNSTLAGALAAVKLHIPLAHVEAGLRSFNRMMPEEHNRVLTDHCADLLFCPTQTAVNHLANESIVAGVHLVGDTMYDAILQFSDLAEQRSKILERFELTPGEYLLATLHRPCNTDVSDNLERILHALIDVNEIVIFPVHPRTRQKITAVDGLLQKAITCSKIRMVDPVGYLDMLMLEQNARLIMTDSGGIQKEAYLFGIPCITLRSETEWAETVAAGWNVLVGANRERIVEMVLHQRWPAQTPQSVFGMGQAASKIVHLLSN